MQYNLGRIGPYLSDRILITQNQGAFTLRVAGSFWDWVRRVVSWIYAPASYTDENRRTIACFRKMIAPLGQARLQRICERYDINLIEMEKKGSPLLSRTIAHFSVALADPQIVDMEEARRQAQQNPALLPPFFCDELCKELQKVSCVEELSTANFAKLYTALSHGARSFPLPTLGSINGSAPTECLACLRFDRFTADRERLGLQADNWKQTYEEFAYNFCIRTMRREMDVGMIIPAPNRADGQRQFYRVAARLVTGEGLVSYCLVPATKDTDLKPIQFYRGTSTTPGELDFFSSIITDLDPQIGQTAWLSEKKVFRPLIQALLPDIEIVAGHSLGSTLAQMDLVKNPKIRKAFLFCGPALPLRKVTQFNQRMQKPESTPVELTIHAAQRDDLSAMGGDVHLGFEAPEKVSITYRQHSAMNHVSRFGVHTMLWHEQKFYGIEGGHHTKELDNVLDHRKNYSYEWLRAAVGPYLTRILRAIRDLCRRIFGSRTLQLRGLQIGTYERGPNGVQWTSRLIREEMAAKAMLRSPKFQMG